MKYVTPPVIDHRAHYQTCVRQTRDNAVKALLLSMTSRVVRAGESYGVAAAAGNLHTVKKMPATSGESRWLSQVYDRRMVPRTGSGRAVYEEIKESVAGCPYCDDGEIYELDHFLPKGSFPELNVLPLNLVPICHPCNNIKLERRPKGSRERFLHPYFDRLPQNERWLFAELKRSGDGPVLTFRAELDKQTHGALAYRLEYHFRELELDRRFKEGSATILVELEAILDEHLNNLDAIQMAAHYDGLARRSLRLHGNRLETAALFAAAENEEYCSGGFRN